MTIQEYEKFEEKLKANGYRKYQGGITNDDYYWCKGVEYQEDKWGDLRPSYQIAYSVWDYRDKPYKVEDRNMICLAAKVIISGDGRIDLELTNDSFSIKEVETKAQSFYGWAKQNFSI